LKPSSGSTDQIRPSWLPEAHFDTTTGPKWDDFGKHYTELATRDAANTVRMNALPTADTIKFDLPKDFKLPEGMTWAWKTDAPEFTKFKEIAVKRGLDQDTITDIAGLYAELQVGEQSRWETIKKADMEKLGANVTARVTALETFFNGLLGPELGGAVKMGLYSSNMVKAMETIASKFASQGVMSFRQDGREVQTQGRVSEAEYNAMSPAERWNYSRSFDQKQFQNGPAR
jgi:hypothetical protein